MAYREVRMMDIDQVICRWLPGEKIRAIARSTGSDRSPLRKSGQPQLWETKRKRIYGHWDEAFFEPQRRNESRP